MKSIEELFNTSIDISDGVLDEILSKSPISDISILASDDFDVPEEVPVEQILIEFKKEVLQEVFNIVPEKGDKGERGLQGEKGKDGKDGRDGKDGKPGKDGKDGVDGKDGISVVDADIAADNSLVLYLSDGKEIDAGSLTGLVGAGKDTVVRASTTFGNAVDFLAFNIDTPSEIVPGQMAWNKVEDCVEVAQTDGSTLQVGLEQYIQVRNGTAGTLTNGTVVGFSGVNGGNIPLCSPYTADSNAIPLYFIGVLTNDIASNEVGRVTVFGKVRTLNTTGTPVGETWAIGDLLWAHPSQAGKLTNVQPTSPYPAISVAAVLKVGTTDGIILVRSTIFPRLWGADWYSTETQTPAVINTPYRITLNNAGLVSGFTNSSGLITALHTGQYNFQFSLQVTSTNSSNAYYYIWYRKNGVDVPNSATKVSIASNQAVAAPSWNFPVSLAANDTFELMWASDSTNVSLSASVATSFHPAIPSVILTVTQINL